MKNRKLPESTFQPLTKELFEEIYSSYKNQIYNFAYKMIGNKTIAEDITQETFIRIYEKYKLFKGRSKLSTWIYTIAKNICFQSLKKSQKSSFHLLEDLIYSNNNLKDENKYEELEKKYYIYQVKEGCLLGLLRCLSLNQRLAFILNILFEISIKDVSIIISKSENSTRILIHRARNNIKMFLCKNCSLYDNKNKCKCENLISFSLKQNWIEKYKNSVPQKNVESELKEFKDEILLYKSLKKYDLKKRISDLVVNKKYLIFSEKKVK
jgi:RNA polymerase sigma-70 factor (ECF subfamily)